MTWNAPITFVAGNALEAADLNAYVRDNLNETAPAKAANATGYFIATARGAIAERLCSAAVVTTSQTTTSTSPVDLATPGPAVTLTTGTNALVFISAEMSGNTDEMISMMTIAVTGATTLASDAEHSALVKQNFDGVVTTARVGALRHFTTLIPGSNTFTAKYEQHNGGTATFANRRIVVIAL